MKCKEIRKYTINILYHLSIIGIVLISFIFCTEVKNQNIPKIQNGIFDLRNIGEVESIYSKLDGEWLFSYGNLSIPTDDSSLVNFKKVQTPSSWTKYEEKYPSFGYATYYLKIYLPKSPDNLSLKIADLGTSYNLFLNGKLIGSKGKVGTNSEESQGQLVSEIYDLKSNGSELNITIQVSNFSHSSGGLWRSIILGNRNILVKERENKIALDLFLIGFSILISIYNLSLYIFRPKDKILLYFSIFSIILSVRLLTSGEKFIFNLMPELSFEISLKLEYLTLIGGMYSFNLFFNNLFNENSESFIYKYFKYTILLNLIIILFGSIWFYSFILIFSEINLFLLIIYVLFVSYKSFINKTDGANIFFLGITILGFTLFNDLFFVWHIINSIIITSFGLIFFILCTTIILSKKFSIGFIDAENLAYNLEISNKNLIYLKENLEIEVSERTTELSHLNDFSRKINSLSNLNEILSEVKEFLISKYDIHTFFLMLYDIENKELFTHDFFTTKKIPDNVVLYIKKFKISSADKAAIYLDFSKNKTPLYFSSKLEDYLFINSNDSMFNDFKKYLTPITIFPLFNGDELVGILNIVSEDDIIKNETKVSKSLSRFINQFIGAIRVTYLTSKNITVQDKMAKIGEIASGIIHDLKNPLSAIKLYAELSESEGISFEKRKEYLKTISTEIDRLTDMTQEILDYVKKDIIIEKEEVKVEDLISSISKFLKPDLDHQGIELSIELKYQDTIYIDYERVRRCILNIMYNSIDSFLEVEDRRKVINLKVKKIFNEICFEIEDNGCGIPTDIKEKIFDNFFTHGKSNGTGIGLYLTKAIIENHKGRIDFESSINLGTIFRVYLPLQK